MFRGHALYIAQAILMIFSSVILFGYNQVGVGGLMSFESWTKSFPEIDTTHTTGCTNSHKSSIQGLYVS
jgi:uncharacterized linocin/CFP29 family protein